MTILVAEIGWNFVGDLNLAKKMIHSAKMAGADAVKFQIWDPKYLKKGPWDKDGRREIYKKAYLNKKKYLALKKYSKKKSIKCFSSAFNLEGLKLLYSARDRWIKIPSHEAYNLKLINLALKKFNKIFISVGCLKKSELKKVITLINSNKKYKKKTTLLHCVSSYPLDIKNCNFYKFHFLKKNFDDVGYSGHLQGNDDAIYALYNGATVIEKHFTTNNNLPGRDNKFALNTKQFAELNRIRKMNNHFQISRGLDLQKCETEIFKKYRGRWTKKN